MHRDAPSRQLDRVDDLRVAGAPANVSGERLANLHGGRLMHTGEEVVRGDDEAWRAETALNSAGLDECLLHRMQSAADHQTFNRHNHAPVGLPAQDEASAGE